MNTTSQAGAAETPRKNTLIRLVAAFKFVEAAACVASGLAALKLLDPATVQWIKDWADTLPLAAEQHVARYAIGGFMGLEPHQVKELGIAAFLFAVIFLIEGVGLWLGKLWAEWFSVIATSLFIPLEIAELFKHASAGKGFALVVNLLVVGYLIAHIKRNR